MVAHTGMLGSSPSDALDPMTDQKESPNTRVDSVGCRNAPYPVFVTLVVTQLRPTLCDLMDCSTAGFPVLHHLPEFAQTHVL